MIKTKACLLSLYFKINIIRLKLLEWYHYCSSIKKQNKTEINPHIGTG